MFKLSNKLSNQCILESGEVVDFNFDWFYELIEELKSWRLNMAKIVALPPYCIYSDKVMSNIAQILPTEKEMLWLIDGFNQTLIETHGKELIELINGFLLSKKVVEVLHGAGSFNIKNQKVKGILGFLGLLPEIQKLNNNE